MRPVITNTVSFLLVAVCPCICLADEVWVGHTHGSATTDRYSFDGTYLGTIGPSGMGLGDVVAMETVGHEVWAGSLSYTGILRFDDTGNYLGIISIPGGVVDAIHVVVDEVWGHTRGSANTGRYGFDGTLLGTVSPSGMAMGDVVAMETVGHEVWVGSHSYTGILRLDEAGNYLGMISTPGGPVEAIHVVGDEVWGHTRGSANTGRYGFDGTLLGTVDPSGMAMGDVVAMETVGDEVWIGSLSYTGILRYDETGNYLGMIATSEGGVHALLAIPEPTSLGLLSVGIALLLRRRRRQG